MPASRRLIWLVPATPPDPVFTVRNIALSGLVPRPHMAEITFTVVVLPDAWGGV